MCFLLTKLKILDKQILLLSDVIDLNVSFTEQNSNSFSKSIHWSVRFGQLGARFRINAASIGRAWKLLTALIKVLRVLFVPLWLHVLNGFNYQKHTYHDITYDNYLLNVCVKSIINYNTTYLMIFQ